MKLFVIVLTYDVFERTRVVRITRTQLFVFFSYLQLKTWRCRRRRRRIAASDRLRTSGRRQRRDAIGRRR